MKKVEVEVDVVVKWNNVFEFLAIARKEWEELQEELNFISSDELEIEYSAEAQKFLTKFRNVRFDWVLPMLVDYWKGQGGLDNMLIKVEKKVETKKKEKDDDGKD